jgi:sugar/nucleoside kinase (ribokinase family)
MRDIDVIVAGHLCIDLIPRMTMIPLEALTEPGKLYEVGALDISTGGAVSNTGLALQRLGVNVRLLSHVGNDLIGKLIVDFLNSRDPEVAQFIAPVKGVSSSYSVVLSPQHTDRMFLHHPGTNSAFGVDSFDYSIVERARVVHLGYPPLLPRLYANEGQELVEIFARLKARKVVTSLDMSLPDASGEAGKANWHAILMKVLPYVDIFVPSFDEITFMLRREDYEASNGHITEYITGDYVKSITNEMIAMGVAVAGVKCGVDGVLVSTASSARMDVMRQHLDLPPEWDSTTVVSPSFEVTVAGTTGAGDSAYAGFLAATIKGETPADAVRCACAVGACNVEAADATSGVQDWDATKVRIQSGWQTNRSRLVE